MSTIDGKWKKNILGLAYIFYLEKIDKLFML